MDSFPAARAHMVRHTLAEPFDGRPPITDPRVLEVMAHLPREQLIPEELRDRAYDDHPLSIGFGQTISQPYIVALMTELLAPAPDARVLEVGTGSGYQTAVLAALVEHVYSIEIVEPLALLARESLARLGVRNVTLRCGDGHAGWPEHAPFDGILVTAAPEQVPSALLEQLAVGGRLVIPVGHQWADQELQVYERTPGGLTVRNAMRVRFVPLTSA